MNAKYIPRDQFFPPIFYKHQQKKQTNKTNTVSSTKQKWRISVFFFIIIFHSRSLMQPTRKIWSECEYKSQQRFVSFFHSCWFCLLGLAWANDVFTQFFLCDNKTITLSLTAHTQTHKHIKCNKSEFTWTTPDTQDNNTKNDDEKSHPNWIKTDDDGDGARCFLYALSRCSSHAFFDI